MYPSLAGHPDPAPANVRRMRERRTVKLCIDYLRPAIRTFPRACILLALYFCISLLTVQLSNRLALAYIYITVCIY